MDGWPRSRCLMHSEAGLFWVVVPYPIIGGFSKLTAVLGGWMAEDVFVQCWNKVDLSDMSEFIMCVNNHFVFETCVSRCKIRALVVGS